MAAIINIFMKTKSEITPFKEETFYEVLELTYLHKSYSDEQLIELYQTKLNLKRDTAEKYLESIHEFFSCGIF